MEERIAEIAMRLARGVTVVNICYIYSAKWSLSDQQVRNIIKLAEEREASQLKEDAPHLTARRLRRLGFLAEQQTADKKYNSAAKIIEQESRLADKLVAQDTEIDDLRKALGAPPTDKDAAREWLRQALLIEIRSLQSNSSSTLDPVARIRMISDLSEKVAKLSPTEDEEARERRDTDSRADLSGALASVAASLAARNDPK